MDVKNQEIFNQMKTENPDLTDQEIDDIIGEPTPAPVEIEPEQGVEAPEVQPENNGEEAPEPTGNEEEPAPPLTEEEAPKEKYVPLEKHFKMRNRAQGAEAQNAILQKQVEELQRQMAAMNQQGGQRQVQAPPQGHPTPEAIAKKMALDNFRTRYNREPDSLVHPEDQAELAYLMSQATYQVAQQNETQQREATFQQQRIANYQAMEQRLSELSASEPRIREIADYAYENLPRKKVDAILAQVIDEGKIEALMPVLEDARKMFYKERGWSTEESGTPAPANQAAPLTQGKIAQMNNLPKISGMPPGGNGIKNVTQDEIQKAMLSGDWSKIPQHVQDQILGSPLT